MILFGVVVKICFGNVDAKRIFAVMSLGVKCGDTVVVSCEGADAEAACAGMKAVIESNL